MSAFKRISLRELHEKTGTLIREASAGGHSVVVTDRGKPLVTITPYLPDVERRRFRDREMAPAFVALQRRDAAGDSTHDVSADRDLQS